MQLLQLRSDLFSMPKEWLLDHLQPMEYRADALAKLTHAAGKELQRLVDRPVLPITDALVIIDEWSEKLFLEDSVDIANQKRNLLHLLFQAFEASPLLDWIAQRLEMSRLDLLEEANTQQLLCWWKLWIANTYPATAALLLGKKQHREFQPFQKIPLQQIIQYLPAFMVWNMLHYVPNLRHRFMLKNLAEGKNIRHLKVCLFPLSKKMAHWFALAPYTFSFNKAIFYGTVMGLKGDHQVFQLLWDHLGTTHSDIANMKTLVDFFLGPGKEVSDDELERLFGFINHLCEETPPGALSMIKNWTLNSLRRRADAWYEEINNRRQIYQMRSGVTLDPSWEGAHYKSYEFVGEQGKYLIVQLNTLEDLSEEGKKMQHCVGSYGWKCQQFGASIWSLRLQQEEGTKSLVTIEVDKKGKILQAFGKYNSKPKNFYWELICQWADREGINTN